MDKGQRELLEHKIDVLTRPDFVAGWREIEDALGSLVKNCEAKIIASWDEKEILRLKLLRSQAMKLLAMPAAMVNELRGILSEDAADSTVSPVDRFVRGVTDANSTDASGLNFAGSTGVKQEAGNV